MISIKNPITLSGGVVFCQIQLPITMPPHLHLVLTATGKVRLC